MAGFDYEFVIKWARGYYRHAPNSTGRPKKMIGLDAPWATTVSEVVDFATKQNNRYNAGQVPDNITIDLADMGDTWVDVGDRVNTFTRDGSTVAARVVSMKATQFNNAFTKFTPQLGTVQKQMVERFDVDLKATGNGTDGGKNQSTTLFRNTDSGMQSGQLGEPSIETFAFDAVDLIDSSVVEVKEPMILTVAQITFSAVDEDMQPVAATLPGDVTFNLFKNSSLETYVTVPGGHSQWTVLGSILVVGKDKLMWTIDDLGTNTVEDTAALKASVKFDTAPATLNRQSTALQP